MALQGRVATSVQTDPGRVRKNNEDAVDEIDKLGLLILADGMGGYKAGEIASGICVATIKDAIRNQWSQLRQDDIDEESGFSAATLLLRDALVAAHGTIYEVSQSQPQCEGMGTTAVVLLLYNNRASIAYVGDSRLYRLRGEELEQITTDHSLVEEMVARGLYSREDALKNVNSNIVTRALGIEPQVEVDMLEEPLQVGDVLLICSDGLTDLVSDEIIRLTLLENIDNLELSGERLIKLANDRGGKDNISVILARIDQPFDQAPRWYERLREWL
mgnify:CR=1 FL=1